MKNVSTNLYRATALVALIGITGFASAQQAEVKTSKAQMAEIEKTVVADTRTTVTGKASRATDSLFDWTSDLARSERHWKRLERQSDYGN